MCGIAGILGETGRHQEAERTALRMADALASRGPDDRGSWVDERAQVALAHRRLSIIDLSSEGHQPMTSADGRFVAVYNGEIYNFRGLRAELEHAGHTFRGHSDTEVMLAAFSQWGVPGALERFDGMFAIGLWDREASALFLARDRIGEKPLYYGWAGRSLLFASQPAAFLRHPTFDAAIDREALTQYLRFNYIPCPRSIYRGIRKLQPGSYLELREGPPGTLPAPTPYWRASEIVERGLERPYRGSEAEAVQELDALLRRSVHARMEADVPLGAFLSGGVDSSTVVAMMQAEGQSRARTFTVGFEESGFDESVHAREVASRLATDHTEVILSTKECLEIVPALPRIYDEPFSDSSQIPTALVSAVTRRSVKVALSGDGGDELFGGYTRYSRSARLWRTFDRIPQNLRKAAGRIAASGVPLALARWLDALRPPGPRQFARAQTLVRAAGLLSAEVRGELYLLVQSHLTDPGALALGAAEPARSLADLRLGGPASFLDWMMYVDLATYLPDDILLKVDRAAMAVGLETRVPLLDHHVIEFAWSLPTGIKTGAYPFKRALRQVLAQYLPVALFDRPKAGFEVPIASWLRGPLKEWAAGLLDERRLRSEGYLDAKVIAGRWQQHGRGTHNWLFSLWDVLMFEAWLEAQRSTALLSPEAAAGMRSVGP